MVKRIPDEIIQDVRSSNDIVDIVSETVRLKRQGHNFIGLCPFHNEKTPSFTVSQDKQIFRCFGCGEGGNVFSFIMKRDNLSFPDAIKTLAKRAGIAIPETEDPRAAAENKRRKRFYEINELAANFYHYILLNHKSAEEARAYLKSRQIKPETAENFQLGYALPSWDALSQFLQKKGCHMAELEQAGLVVARNNGSGYYDRFRNRIIFPIKDLSGQVVGFGGRVMDDSQPKYLNSPETPLFNKGTLLYGLNRAVEGIRRDEKVIIVEGYMDVIACHQAGITNAVASLGTALTKEQGKLLLRHTRDMTIAYDSDTAGVNAALRGWQVLDELGSRVKVVKLPDGKDPDEFIRNNGLDKFMKVLDENALSLPDYLAERAMEKYDIYTLEGKFKIASEVIPSIKNMSNEIEKEDAVLRLAQRLHISPDAIITEVKKSEPNKRNSWIKPDKNAVNRDNKSNSGLSKKTETLDARAKAEKNIISLIIDDPKLLNKLNEEIGLNFTVNQEYLNIINILDRVTAQEINYTPAALFDMTQDQATLDTIKGMAVSRIPSTDKEKLFNDCIKVIRDDENRKVREDLLKRMEEADRNRDEKLRQKLLLEYTKLI